MKRYLFTEEWDEGSKVHVYAYGLLLQNEIDNIVGQMERYSPYDYVDYLTCDTKQEYDSCLQCRIDNGSEIKYITK